MASPGYVQSIFENIEENSNEGDSRQPGSDQQESDMSFMAPKSHQTPDGSENSQPDSGHENTRVKLVQNQTDLSDRDPNYGTMNRNYQPDNCSSVNTSQTMFHSNSNGEPTDQSRKPGSTTSNSLESTRQGLSKTNRVLVRGDFYPQKNNRGPSTECHSQYQEYHRREEKRRLQKRFHKQNAWQPENLIKSNKTWCGDPNPFSDTSELRCNLDYPTNIQNLKKKRLEKIRRLELEDNQKMYHGQ
jgi:hypothetical protein